jgi:glycosyltransferase involved in cell wall biosynthesis
MAAGNRVEGDHELALIVDRQTADEWRFPEGVTVEVVPTREQPTRVASSEGRRTLGDLWRMRRAATLLSYDAFFFPAVYSYYPIPRRTPSLVTFHDAIAEIHPELIFPNRRTRWAWNAKVRLALRQATRVLTVSQAAKDQIAESFGYARARIDVITEAAGPEFRIIEDPEIVERVLERQGFARDAALILFVGGISPHKNLDGLMRAVAGLAKEGVEHWQLGLVGDYRDDAFLGCYDALQRVVCELQIEDRVNFTGYVSEEDLVTLYNAATVIVIPSFSEGFGLPAVEAMACGAPVVASRRGSLPEVLGPAGLYFDPGKPEEMRAAIGKVLREPALRDRLIAAGRAQAAKHSWTDAARQVLAYLERLAGCRS